MSKISLSRTERQNNALHLFFRMLAERLNEAGLDMRTVLKPGIDIPWNAKTVKEYLWRPIQKVYLGKRSTTELDKNEDIDQIYEILYRHLSEKFGVNLPDFPSIERQIYKDNKTNT